MSEAISKNGAAPAGVLICDDHEAIRELLDTIVSSDVGLRVVGAAADGNAAIAEAARLQPDVILLDLAMPKLSGFDALPEIRRVAPDAAIVVFSGFASSAVAEEVIALGATCYLEKGGADPNTIVATIEQVLATARALS